jgi:hypothetical protein
MEGIRNERSFALLRRTVNDDLFVGIQRVTKARIDFGSFDVGKNGFRTDSKNLAQVCHAPHDISPCECCREIIFAL